MPLKPVSRAKRQTRKPLKPNGRNIEIALELLELSLMLKESLKKTEKRTRADHRVL